MNQGLKDKISLILLLLFVFFLNSYGLGVLEFIRHTEADRTLIAWGMVESGNYLIPQLIHSTILTKPPLFYWAIALSIKLMGGVDEYVARLPSVIISVLFVLSQYLTWKRAGAESSQARFAAIVLFSGMSFFILSTAAEIDMLFSFLCAVTFYFSYFSLKDSSFKDTLFSYFFAALAFLTKGPPIVFFFIAIHFGFWFFLSIKNRKWELKNFIFYNLIGIGVFLLITGIWLFLLANQVGWQEIVRQFRIEVLQRIADEKHNPRGYFFYLGSVALGMLPWSIFLLIAIFSWIKSISQKERISFLTDNLKSFFQFNLFAFTVAFVMLTIAKGKSDRYIFPVYACIINLVPFAFYQIKIKKLDYVLFKMGQYFFPLLSVAAIACIYFLKVPNVSSLVITQLCLISFFLSWYFFVACRKFDNTSLLFGLLILIFVVRLFYVEVYSVSRNYARSVKNIAVDIRNQIPEGEVLYNIEVFERWINYYLKHLGRETYRLTPDEIKTPRCKERCFILIDQDEENWRLEQLKARDPELQVLNQYRQGNNYFVLVKVSVDGLSAVQPEKDFPTVPTEPKVN